MISINKTLILIAGMPGTGKTRFANYLSDKLHVTLICKDKLKEIIWDKVHYNSRIRSETQKYGSLAYDLSFHFCEMLMKSNQPIIFESNFPNPCPDFFKSMIATNDYKVITVLFTGDIHVIHKRFLERDVTEERHPGLVSGDEFADFETFKHHTKPCREWDFGDEKIIVDTTDFSNVSYDELVLRIRDASKML